MEPSDCKVVVGMGVAVDVRLGGAPAPPGAGLAVVVAVDTGSEEGRGLLSDRSTGSVWSSAGAGSAGAAGEGAGEPPGRDSSFTAWISDFTFRSTGWLPSKCSVSSLTDRPGWRFSTRTESVCSICSRVSLEPSSGFLDILELRLKKSVHPVKKNNSYKYVVQMATYIAGKRWPGDHPDHVTSTFGLGSGR